MFFTMASRSIAWLSAWRTRRSFSIGEGRALLRVHLQEHDAHRLAADHLQIRHGLDLVGLVLRHVHEEVQAAGEQLRHLRLPVGDEADLDLPDAFAWPFGESLK